MTTLFINNTDLMSKEWRFIEPYWTDPRATWAFHHGVPGSWLESSLRRPNLARYRAALSAVRQAAAGRPDTVLVSHLPAMSAATNLLRRRLCPDVAHIAFAFNFTELPQGPRLAYFQWALRGIDEFVVFSDHERDLYANTFGIPADTIRMLHWAMEAPRPGAPEAIPFADPYLCAVGGEGRDYRLLADVMRHLPEMRLAIVARPYSIAGIAFPENVRVFTNLPLATTWRLAADSIGMVVPLKTAETACGHITIVGAQLLGIPLVVSRSSGVRDYVSDETASLVLPGNAAELIDALQGFQTRPDRIRARREQARQTAEARSSLSHWVRYFEGKLDG